MERTLRTLPNSAHRSPRLLIDVEADCTHRDGSPDTHFVLSVKCLYESGAYAPCSDNNTVVSAQINRNDANDALGAYSIQNFTHSSSDQMWQVNVDDSVKRYENGTFEAALSTQSLITMSSGRTSRQGGLTYFGAFNTTTDAFVSVGNGVPGFEMPKTCYGPDIVVSGVTNDTIEEGSSETFQVGLSTRPSFDVTMTLTLSSSSVGPLRISTIPTEIVFTDATWENVRTVEVKNVDDYIAQQEDGATGTVNMTLSSASEVELAQTGDIQSHQRRCCGDIL